MKEYFDGLRREIERAYGKARKARARGMDPSPDVEALPAGDLAARVEGRVGPRGIAEKIRETGRHNIPEIVDSILAGEFGMPEGERILQATRTALDIYTEGVVAAPIEGISNVRMDENPDGSKYLSIYFAGPIRSAGGTGQGIAVLVADYIRKKLGLKEYRPTADEVERYVEEVKIYNDRISRLQYMPSDEDVRIIVKNVPVCITGDPTEQREVAIHRDLKRVETNRIRGGTCLVVAEGIAQKSRKLRRIARDMGLDWNWLDELGQKRGGEDMEESDFPIAKFMDEIVGGRPIFAAPSAKGAFRLRYGRTRASGIAAKSFHPATMILLDGFIATGTQVKVEKPGKGCIITECDTIEGPIVRLRDGSVTMVETVEQARDIKPSLDQILHLGDILVSFGDFWQTNTRLLPAGYCEEWWLQEMGDNFTEKRTPAPEEAVELSKRFGVPLHPRYTYRWEDISIDELKTLVAWLLTGKISDNMVLGKNAAAKAVLESLGVPHRVQDDSIIVDEFVPLLAQLGIENLSGGKIGQAMREHGDSAFDVVSGVSAVRIRRKVGTYIGCRMGRPEKAKERRMQPAVHVLFPVGESGGRERSVNVAAQQNTIPVEIVQYVCPKCGSTGIGSVCRDCGTPTRIVRTCPRCGIKMDKETCPRCNVATRYFTKQDVDIGELWQRAVDRTGRSENVKGVRGMISEYKVPEPLEKGILRASNDIYVFKDGTIRFDATDAPLTHFRPREIGVSVERLRELGYHADYRGEPLTSDRQIVEMRVQDIVIPVSAAKYLLRVSWFADQLLEKFYETEPYYNAKSIEDMVGQLTVGLAPHTSAGIIGRIIGFTRANVCYAHPYWHAAKRRNCDGDEDSVMLLMDVLLNFSRKYLPEKRGGHMDAPLVITTVMDPKEIDDEAHKMEIVERYPLDFYDKTWKDASPAEVDLPTVSSILNKNPYSGLNFTHDTSDITGPVQQSQYVKLETMAEKVTAQLAIAEKIRAINEKDVAELVINSHFLRDTYGNLRAFSRQRFRCVKCNANYRRVPLAGKCTKCGGKLLLTVTEGNIRKYLETSRGLAEKYHLSDYLKQRLMLLDRDITSLFTNDLAKQVKLADFM